MGNRSVKQYDLAIMKRIGELQTARLVIGISDTESEIMKRQADILYDIWHEVTHKERLIDPIKPKASLVEGQFEGMYLIQTMIQNVHFESSSLHTIKQVKERGFIIEHIKDR